MELNVYDYPGTAEAGAPAFVSVDTLTQPESLTSVRALRQRRWMLWGVLAVALVGLAWGWHVFRFLCDDAYIGFRYIGNAVAGLGLTWNPAPFRTVEGYTSFLWEVLLVAIWKLTGLDPTEVAAELGLLCAAGAVVHIWRMAQAIPLDQRLDRWRPAWVALVLLGTLSNRTFLAWTSGGLETPLFTLLVLGWVDAVARRRYLAITLHAALLPLCRPDGLLLLAATFPVLLFDWRRVRPVVLLPLLIVPLHLLWRHATYGFWVPNTFCAKVTHSFTESGWRYFACWMLEYAWWFAGGVGLVALLLLLRRGELLRLRTWPIAVAAVLANAGWYTFWVGGDHFEYRIYTHLVPLTWLALLGTLGALRASPRASAVVLVSQLLLSLPIPWTHWAFTHELMTRKETRDLSFAVAPRLPALMRPYTAAFDELQVWLIAHKVCMRHQEHAIFAKHQLAHFPPRPSLAAVVAAWTNPLDIAVGAIGSAGVVGWSLPQVAIIDVLGLNDAVVARNPDLRPGRNMTHERQPAAGYVESFRPNVSLTETQLIITPRELPLRPAEVEAIERSWWERVGIAR